MRNSISSVVLACCTALFAMLLLVAAAMSGAPRHSNALACSATADDGATVHESADASGLRAALTHAVSISATTVKVAGTCAGVISQTGSAQLALITRAVTLEGGYTPTHWLANYPMTQPTTLDAQGAGRVLRSSANITVNDMLLMNGLITGNGGGLLAEANARLLGVIFQNNQASGDGGGAYIGGRARVLDTRAVSNSAGASGGGIATGDVSRVTFAKFIANTAALNGGGLFALAPITVTDSYFEQNASLLLEASDGTTGGGGIMANEGAEIHGSLFYSNSAASYGGGVLVNEAALLDYSLFVANHAGLLGGGVHFDEDAVLEHSAFRDNRARAGGAVNAEDNLIARANLMLRNIATDTGGGIHIQSIHGETANLLVNNILAANSVISSGGLGAQVAGGDTLGTLTLVHNTLADATRNSGSAVSALTGTLLLTNNIISNHALGLACAGAVACHDAHTLYFDNAVDRSGPGTVTQSVRLDPRFINATAGNFHISLSSGAVGRALPGQADVDIDDDPRPQLGTHDIGADETMTGFRIFLPLTTRSGN